MRLLPLKQVRRIISRVTEAERCGDLLYQAPGGQARLKSELGRYLAERDIPLSDDLDILVTNGAQHGLDIFARSFVSRTGVVAVETPTYYGAIAAMTLNGLNQVAVPQDAKGLSITALSEICRNTRFDFLYTNPTFNNPSGMTLTSSRRNSLAR